MNEREFIRMRVSQVAGGHVTHWTDERTSIGDFDGRDWTLEIFDVPSSEQRELHARLWSLREVVRKSLGHSLTFIFHRPEETERLYPWARQAQATFIVDTAGLAPPRIQAQRLTPRWGPEPLPTSSHTRAAWCI